MNKGHIIFLNGVTSTGKTSIIKEIISHKRKLFYTLSYDLFEETIPEWVGEAELNYSEAIIAMYHAARSFSDQGRDVLIDGLVMNIDGLREHYQTLKTIFEGYPLKMVEVYCPLEICRMRNIARGDRGEYQSHKQSEIMEKQIEYHYRIDSGSSSIEECADLLLDYIK